MILVVQFSLFVISTFTFILRRQTMAIEVEPSNVAIQNFTESIEGRLIFNVYVVLEDGILSLNGLQNALRVRLIKKWN